MENRKGSEIFLGVIGVATLLVAIIGATFAFFSANAASNEDAIVVDGAVLKLGYSDNTTLLKHNLIPAKDYIAHFSATDEDHMADPGVCIDDVGNEICGYYTFKIGNPSFTTQQGLYGKIKIVDNSFANLSFEILDETKTVVVPKTNFKTAVDSNGEIALTQLEQQLVPTNKTAAEAAGNFNELNPETYPAVCVYDGETCTQTNVRTYTMVIWIDETGSDQTEADSGMTFSAGINFTSANDTTGVTGVISAAKDPNAEAGA